MASLGLATGFFLALLFQRYFFSIFIELPKKFRIEELRELIIAVGFTLLMVEASLLLQKKRKTTP